MKSFAVDRHFETEVKGNSELPLRIKINLH